MALTDEHKAKISAAIKARHATDPEYHAKVSANASERGRAGAAKQHAERAERDALIIERDALAEELGTANAEIERLRAEIERLRGDG